MILVTGGTGFIGSTLIVQLLAAGKSVRALKRPSSVIPEVLSGNNNIEWLEADLLNYLDLEAIFDQVTQVYHCAAVISATPKDRGLMMKVNSEGTAHIVDHCLRVGARLLHVSSIATIGQSRHNALSSEKDPWENDGRHSTYALSKYLAEMEVWRGLSEGLDGVIVNPSLVIGKNAGLKGTGMIFHTLKRGIKFYPPGSVGLVDVEDVAKAMVLLMGRTDLTEERYILNGANWSYQELFTRCATYLGKPIPRVTLTQFVLGLAWRGAGFLSWMTGKPAGITKETARSSQKNLAFSNAKIVREIGIAFRPIDETIREICESIKNDN